MFENNFRDIIEKHMEEIMLVTDSNGLVVWANQWFTELTRYTLEEVKGKKPGDFLQGEETDEEAKRIMGEAVAKGEGFNVNVVNYTKKGEKYWLNISCSPIYNEDGVLEYFVAIERDITSEKNKNQERVEKLINEQQKLSDEKIELVKSIILLAHDLKSPLNNIQGLIGISDIQDERLKEMMLSEVKRSKALIDKILSNKNGDDDKIELHHTEFNLFDSILKLVKISEAALEDQSSLNEVSINCDRNLTIKTDKVLFMQIIENLFTNAVKYGEKGTEIIFDIEQVNDLITIEVSNETNTLEEWQLENLFNPFQNFSYDNNKDSNGIGAYIVKKHVNLLGGKIEPYLVKNRVYFKISIPAK